MASSSSATDDTDILVNRQPHMLSRFTDERMSLPFIARLPVVISITALAGFAMGAQRGSSERGYRFRAENAHRLPTTTAGWYFYHKSKNYNMMLGGLKQGMKTAGKLSLLITAFMYVEEATDRARWWLAEWRNRGDEVEYVSRDFFSSSLAGLATAGAFSAWNRFPLPTVVRLAKTGLKGGAAFGLLQDMLGLLRGRRLAYVEFVKQNVLGIGEAEESQRYAKASANG